MDSNVKDKINTIKGLLLAEIKYLEALEVNDADVSEETLNELHSSVFSSFDKLQDGSVKDMLKSIENNPIDKIKTTCKFVSLF